MLSVRNAAGNSSTQEVPVTIQDTTPPDLSIPDPLVITSDASEDIQSRLRSDDARVTAWKESIRATDIADEHPQVTCDLPLSFEPGLNRIKFTATDASGNQSVADGFVMVLTGTRQAKPGRVASPRSR
jgi:hypothetical protein